MTVAELIAKLQEMPGDAVVLVADDSGDADGYPRTYEDPVLALHDLKRDRFLGGMEPVCGVVGEVVVGQGVVISTR